MPKKFVTVNDAMQKGYRYELTAPVGRDFDREFRPELTPKQMLRLGVFGGKYMTDTRKEFPADWFRSANFVNPQPVELSEMLRVETTRTPYLRFEFLIRPMPDARQS